MEEKTGSQEDGKIITQRFVSVLVFIDFIINCAKKAYYIIRFYLSDFPSSGLFRISPSSHFFLSGNSLQTQSSFYAYRLTQEEKFLYH